MEDSKMSASDTKMKNRLSEKICDIELHLDMLLDDEMKRFCGYKDDDDLPMRIFRVVNGYRNALDKARKIANLPAPPQACT